ncbi:TlpA disulfide reductase family protein [Hymenobacter sp. B81]|uniref:TlpA disulfide reductase family protein n=1 Tax=Hymenobacter sp. B81 TaxID=3344878 RepID=UPI0037DC9F38
MNNGLKILLVLLLLAGPAAAQQVRVVKLPAVEQLLRGRSDTTYVLNFWATWCGPCVQELPHFERVRAAHAGQKVRVVLISLDFASQLDKKVRPFVQRHQLASAVWLLNETDPNAYIDRIDPGWSGALPFTLLINPARGQRKAFERPLTQAELETELRAFGH